jgi:hypothetical protein
MQIVCPHCRQTLEFSGKRPAFCAYCGTALPPAADDSTVAEASPAAGPDGDPAEVGGYRLLRVLGEGGMGRVYEAEDAATGRRVALKLIAAEYAGAPAAVERFRREGRLASGVSHPRCVFVLAADEAAGRPYIVMELMPGETLQDLVDRDGPLPVEQALSRILDVIDGLREAHRLGVVHRDVKPSNCFLDAEGRVKVGDFGLSKSLVDSGALTRTGTFLGTPLFASPEQIKSEAVGPQSDVYSVAATLYCLLTGRAPFQGGDSAATLARIVSDPAPPMRSLRRDLPGALDKVVLRGLERDPARRWRGLDDFRAALAPFLPGRLSIGGLGPRFGAFVIDSALLFFLDFVAGLLVTLLVWGPSQLFASNVGADRFIIGEALNGLLLLVYFSVPEALWGCTPGKAWLRLRVCKAGTGERPTAGQAFVRALVLYVVLHASNFVFDGLMIAGAYNPMEMSPPRQLAQSCLVTATYYPTLAGGVALLLCTMRARNGYRGLHELVSGTRVVRLPEPPGRRRRAARDREPEISRADGMPERLGPYDVRGALPGAPAGTILVGQDAALGRRAWIWLRPVDSPPVSAARREVNRTARLRWLAGGREGPSQWDAFLAPAGMPLADAAAEGRMSWAEARSILTQLADELAAAEADGTLPAPLSAAQVWVQADGRVQLLDAAPAAGEGSASPLSLLRQAAVLALEGKPRPPRAAPAGVRAPLPEHAARLLDRLLGAGKPYAGLSEFRSDLAAAADKPTETTRPRRLAHLAVLAVLFWLGPGTGLAIAAILFLGLPMTLFFQGLGIEDLQGSVRAVVAQDAAGALNPDPTTRLLAVRQAREDLQLHDALGRVVEQCKVKHDQVLGSMDAPSRQLVQVVEEQQRDPKYRSGQQSYLPTAAQPDDVRQSAQWQAKSTPDLWALGGGVAVFQTVAIGFMPAAWVVWAFLFRGGLSLPLMGLALVRGNGRPALRFQCAWRALVFWVPAVALATASAWLFAVHWKSGGDPGGWLLSASSAAWWGALLLLPLYAVLAVWFPRRGPHDWLAGTYVVPR